MVGPTRTKLNHRQELYCQFRASGKNQSEAMKLAGYNGPDGSRLERQAGIKERIAELVSNDAVKTRDLAEEKLGDFALPEKEEVVDLNFFLREFKRNLELARAGNDIKGANQCLELMAQLVDLGATKRGSKVQPAIGNNGSGTHAGPTISLQILNQVTDALDRGSGTSHSPVPALAQQTAGRTLPPLWDRGSRATVDGLIDIPGPDDLDVHEPAEDGSA